MGNENSRLDDAAISADAQDGSEASGQLARSSPSQARQSSPQASAKLDNQTTFHDSRCDSIKAQGSLKRPFDEFDRNHRDRSDQRTPTGPKRNPKGDYYRPPSPAFAGSPSDTRYFFIPDRSPDCWRPNSPQDYRRAFSRASPEQTLQTLSSRRRSSLDRRSASPRRSFSPGDDSPVQRTSQPPHVQDIKTAPSSGHARKESDSKDGRVFPNLKWVAQKPVGTKAEPEIARIDFNGLKQVPTGPKQAPTAPKASAHPKVGNPLPHLPHIFVSKDSLPTVPTTVRHLQGFLRKYLSNDAAIAMDASGYYIAFEDTEYGRQRLDLCYKNFHLEKLFSMYTLRMEPYPAGRTLPSVAVFNGSTNSDCAKRNGLSPPTDVQTEATIEHALPGQGSPESENSMLGNAATTDQSKNPGLPPTERTAISSQTLPDSARHLSHSSPLRVPSRADKDDCSSSITGSDMSATKQGKCHVCKTASAFEADSLVHCSSCPRKYHRRCHMQPPIDTELGKEHSWHCRRCVKKEVHPRSRLSNTPLELNSHSRSQSQEPPTKKPRLEAGALDVAAQAAKIVVKIPHVDRAFSGGSPPPGAEIEVEGASDRRHEMAERLQNPSSDEMHLREAEDLVEQSFTFAKTARTGPVKTNRFGALKLIRTKRGRFRTGTHSDISSKPAGVTLPSLAVRTPEGAQAPSAGDAPADAEIISPKRKNKPHRWAGTGADKDIIQAGEARLFPMSEQSHAVNMSVKGSVPQSPADDPSKAHEVATETQAASADVASGGSEDRSAHGLVDASPTNQVLHTIANRIAKICTAPIVDRGSQTPSAPAPPARDSSPQKELNRKLAPSKRRPGPGSNALNKCAKCGRSIPAGPSGTNELCTSCRQKQAADSAPELISSSNTAAKTTQIGFEDNLDMWTPESAPPHSRADTSGNSPLLQPETAAGPVEAAASPPESDLSSEALSDAPQEDLNTPQEERARKRKSYAKTASGEHDLGNYERRPKGTYQKLILLALCDAPEHRLRGTDVVNWIAENIRGYSGYKDKSENHKWKNSIRSILSMGREGTAKTPLWRKIELTEDRCMWELLPGKAAELPRWDPVLGEPVCPPQGMYARSNAPAEADPSLEEGDEDKLSLGRNIPKTKANVASKRATLSTNKNLARPRKNKVVRESIGHSANRSDKSRLHESTSPKNALAGASEESSEEEPIITSGRRAPRAPVAVMGARSKEQIEMTPSKTILSEVDTAQTNNKKGASTGLLDAPWTMNSTSQVNRKTRPAVNMQEFTLAQLIKDDAENVDCSAKSLFEEWPQYHPRKEFDKDAKIAEIKGRPNRKQRMAIASFDPRLQWKSMRTGKHDASSRSSLSLERSFRNSGASLDEVPWTEDLPNEKHFDDLDKFFDLPSHPIPIVHDGQLAYRDGTRNDGVLPRAKVIYKTGYA